MSDGIPLDQVLEECLQDPEFRAEWERHAVADAVSVWLVGVRAKLGLSQRALAAKVGMKQAAIARLEAGDTEPKIATLRRLAKALGVNLVIELRADPQATPAIVIAEAA